MGTRSTIGLQNIDGSVTSIYCHWDGYISGVGKALVNSFPTTDTALSLVRLGDLSSVAGKEGPVAFHRDRNENWEDVQPRVYHSFEDYSKNIGRDYDNNGFHYLFVNGKWFAHGPGVDERDASKLYLVSDLLFASKKES